MARVTLSDIDVMFIAAQGGASGASAAFADLESRLPALRGRRFYGTFFDGEALLSWAMLILLAPPTLTPRINATYLIS